MTVLTDTPSHIGPIPRVETGSLLGWRGLMLDFVKDSIGFLKRVHNAHGEIAFANGGGFSTVFTFSPEYNRQILTDPSVFYSFGIEDFPFAYKNIKALKSLTSALSLMNGERHRQQRRLMRPPFHNGLLHIYVDDIVTLTQETLNTWKVGEVRDMYAEMDLFSICMAMKIFVGMDPDEEGRQFADLFECVLQSLYNPLVFMLPINFPGFPYRRLVKQGAKLEKDLKDLIERRREKEMEGNDTLSLFLHTHDEDGTKMTDDEVVGQTVAVFRGGSKTSASVLTWTLFLLSQHPQVAADLLDELEGVLKGSPPTYQQLEKLPLLEAVIKESMRLIPPVVLGGRHTTAPTTLGEYELPVGSTVVYSAHITHHLPSLYNDPDRFLPYRWFDIRPSPYEYLPFSAGPRLCLGAGFAMIELKIVLAVILQQYRLELVPGTRIDRKGVIGTLPRHGLPMRIHAQDRVFSRSEVHGNIRKLVELD